MVYVPTCVPEERTRVRKTHAEMELEQLSLNSHDVWKKDIIKHYEDRPDTLESTCLTDFASWYNLRAYRLRKQPAIIQYCSYGIDDD